MNTKPSENGLLHVVSSCRWSVTVIENNIKVSDYGYTQFDLPNNQDFTQYDDLTEEQVLQWVWITSEDQGGVNKENIEKHLSDKIEEEKNKANVVLQNPWDKPEYETPSE